MDSHAWKIAVALLVGSAFVCSLQASPVVLGDGNSELPLDLAGQLLGGDWLVDGVDQLGGMGYAFRVGPAVPGNPEIPLSYLSVIGSAALDTNPWQDDRPDLYAASLGAGVFNVDLRISLVGGAEASGQSEAAHQVKITNNTSELLDFHMFQYMDFDLGGGKEGDSVFVSHDPLSDKPDQVLQTDAASGFVANEHVTPDADLVQVGISPDVLALFMNQDGDSLSGAVGPVGPGDVEYALQWDVMIPAYGSFILSKDLLITPEPGTLALLLGGGLALGLIRRRRR